MRGAAPLVDPAAVVHQRPPPHARHRRRRRHGGCHARPKTRLRIINLISYTAAILLVR